MRSYDNCNLEAVTTVIYSCCLHLYRGNRDGVCMIVVFISAYCIADSCDPGCMLVVLTSA